MIDLRDKKVMQEFFGRFYARACSFAGKLLKDRMIAADIVQEAFLYMWQNVPEFKGEEGAKAYLYYTVRSRCLNYLRDHRTEIRMEELQEGIADETEIDHWIIESEVRGRILEEINKLPEIRREIMMMRLDGNSFEEISQELQLNINTLKTYKKQIYKDLRLRLKDLGEGIVALLLSAACFY